MDGIIKTVVSMWKHSTCDHEMGVLMTFSRSKISRIFEQKKTDKECTQRNIRGWTIRWLSKALHKVFGLSFDIFLIFRNITAVFSWTAKINMVYIWIYSMSHISYNNRVKGALMFDRLVSSLENHKEGKLCRVIHSSHLPKL